MNGVALVNLVMGGYLLYDAFNRLAAHQSLLIFDDYLGGFARYIPILLAIGLILTAILLFVKKSTSWLFFSYVISFLVLITCTILLYATRERGKGSASVLHRETYSEYKKGMKQFKDPESKTGRKNSRPE